MAEARVSAMDVERAIEVLEWWVKHANASRVNLANSGGRQAYAKATNAEVENLRGREDQTRRVLARALNLKASPEILKSFDTGRYVVVSAGVELCETAIGRLRTDDETRAILGSSAPTMAADALHPTIWDSASKRWDAGHYADAVQRAATFLNAELQSRTGRTDLADTALMRAAFSLEAPTAERPRLRWPGPDDDLTVKAMRVGILNYSQGVFSAIRNPATHSTGDLGRQEALEQLAALSMLARWIDQCELITIESHT
jgi:hypothetical protein